MTDPILQAHANIKAKQVSDKISRRLQSIATMVDKELSALHKETFGDVPDTGKPLFSLFVYHGGNAQYVANAAREDVTTVVATVLSRWSIDEEDKPLHEQTDIEKAPQQ